MLDELGGSSALVRWISGGAFEEGDFDIVRALLELGALDAGDRLRSGATPFVVVTEDSNSDHLRAVLASSGFRDGTYDIWSYAGSTEVRAAKILARFIQEHAPGTRVIIHRDRDYLSDNAVAGFEADVQSVGAVPFVTEGTDLESHFISVDHLVTVFPELTADRISTVIDQATTDTAQYSRETMITSRNEEDLRDRRRAGSPQNPGAVATACDNDIAANPSRYRHGRRLSPASFT